MQFSPNSMVSIDEILADVTRNVDDEDMRIRPKGWYVRKIKQGLENLAFQTFFDKRWSDYNMPENLKLEYPKGAFNLIDIFVFNSKSCDPDATEQDDGIVCDVRDMQRVMFKNNFISKGKDYGYTARNHAGNVKDRFIRSFTNDSDILYYGVQNGVIMLSDYCQYFDKIRIVYNGIGSDIHSSKIIPPFCREAIVKYVTCETFFSLKAKDHAKYRLLWSDANTDLYSARSRSEASVWDEAKYRLKALDKKQREDLAEYFSRPDI